MMALNALRDGAVLNTCIQGSRAQYMITACVSRAQTCAVLILKDSYWLLKELKNCYDSFNVFFCRLANLGVLGLPNA